MLNQFSNNIHIIVGHLWNWLDPAEVEPERDDKGENAEGA